MKLLGKILRMKKRKHFFDTEESKDKWIEIGYNWAIEDVASLVEEYEQ